MQTIKKLVFIIIIATLIFNVSMSQEKIEYSPSKKNIENGYKLLELGRYEKALSSFELVYEGDSLFWNYALHERMKCLHLLKRDEEAKQLGDKYWNFRHKLPTEFYLMYGTVLDFMEEYDEAHAMYESILQEFPMNYSIWYNYGVSLSLAGNHEKAYEAFKTTVQINPFYYRVHYAIALYCLNEKQTSKALMAFSMYLILSVENGDNSSQLAYADYIARAKYWADEDYKGSYNLTLDGNSDYTATDQLVHNYISLNSKYKTKSKLSYPS
jgi:tetratricopeptide (TPR) repeat protein